MRGLDQLVGVASIIRALSPEKVWRITFAPYRAKRSLEQNALLWAVYSKIAEVTGNDTEDIHEAMKMRYLPPKFVKLGEEEVALPAESRSLDLTEFSQFVEKVQAFAAQELGIPT